jgi:hypothetical protein
VSLCGLAHYESVDLAPASRCLVHDCGCDWIGAHGQTAGSIKVGNASSIEHVEHYLSDKWGSLVVQGGSTQINVVVGFDSARQRDATVHNGKVLD